MAATFKYYNNSTGQWEAVDAGGINDDTGNRITPSKIGVLSNLQTANRDSLVGSMNEILGEVKKAVSTSGGDVTGTLRLKNSIPYRLESTSPVYIPSSAQSIAYYKKSGANSFYWRKSDNGENGGANEITLLELKDDGTLQFRMPDGTYDTVQNLKSSVASGKNSIASAISGKGVSASGSDSFATLASKIGQINTGIPLAYGAARTTAIRDPNSSDERDYIYVCETPPISFTSPNFLALDFEMRNYTYGLSDGYNPLYKDWRSIGGVHLSSSSSNTTAFVRVTYKGSNVYKFEIRPWNYAFGGGFTLNWTLAKR